MNNSNQKLHAARDLVCAVFQHEDSYFESPNNEISELIIGTDEDFYNWLPGETLADVIKNLEEAIKLAQVNVTLDEIKSGRGINRQEKLSIAQRRRDYLAEIIGCVLVLLQDDLKGGAE